MRFFSAIALALLGAAFASAQPAPPLIATYRVETVYPSLTERHVVRLAVDDWDGIWAAHGRAPDPDTWPWTDPKRYYVRRVSDAERVPVERAQIPGFFKGSQPVTLVYLTLDPEVRLKPGEKLEVLLLRDGTATTLGNAPRSNAFAVAAIQKYNFDLAPGYVPNQELADARKRSVGQLETRLDFHQLYTLGGRARGYLNLDAIASTDAKDKASRIAVVWGVFERSLARGWFIPVHLEERFQGDQTFRYSSAVTAFGLRSLIPWRFTKPVLYNAFLQAPVSPVIRFDAEFERRLPRLAELQAAYPDRNQARFATELAWAPIRLLPGQGSEALSLEINAHGWYLPWDRAGARDLRRLEGRVDVGLIVPLAKLNFSVLNFVTDQKDKARQRVRVKYSHGANDALGFVHQSSLSLGVEVIK